MPRNVVVLLDNPEGREMVKTACNAAGIRFAEFQELVEAEIKQTGKAYKTGLRDDFDDILDRIMQEDE
ncbi:MAG: hypothetical protein GDA36_10930 [Rhodobacteraceae bacterium]|nr:hypothetical protein [Paracoccaceae bacterium]